MERGWKPNVEICPPCPRCGSSNTKFCYYNNYSLTQPRYFCKGCRRYWTKGGSLRNIPVGGGCRKTRRAKSVRVSDPVNSHHFRSCGTTGGYGGRENVGNPSSGSMIMQPTNIDIQQVYTNFLNQRPQNNSNQEQMHDQVLFMNNNELDPTSSFEFPSIIPNTEMEFGVTNYGSNFDSFLHEGNEMQFCGYNSVFNNHEEDQEKYYFGTNVINNCGLPLLPGEDMGWSETNIEFSENVLNARIEPEVHVSGDSSVKFFDMPVNSQAIFRP